MIDLRAWGKRRAGIIKVVMGLSILRGTVLWDWREARVHLQLHLNRLVSDTYHTSPISSRKRRSLYANERLVRARWLVCALGQRYMYALASSSKWNSVDEELTSPFYPQGSGRTVVNVCWALFLSFFIPLLCPIHVFFPNLSVLFRGCKRKLLVRGGGCFFSFFFRGVVARKV